jgi:hypothetical protein
LLRGPSHQLFKFNVFKTSTFRNSMMPLFFEWMLHAGVRIRESIRAASEEMMYVAKLSQSQQLQPRS